MGENHTWVFLSERVCTKRERKDVALGCVEGIIVML